MAFKLNKNDRMLIASIAEHRMLTVSQIAAIQQKMKQVVRRRLRVLEYEGFIASTSRGFGRKAGRREKVVILTEKSIDLLYAEGVDRKAIPGDRFAPVRIWHQDHQLLLNWFRIHGKQIERVIPQLSVQFLSSTSPFLERDQYDRPLVFEHLSIEGLQDKSRGFTPDAVFSITHSEKKKALLFFLEVDMGTESIASPKRDPRDLRQKVINYQRYFQCGRYKRYQKLFHSKFSGFRLLFITNSNQRFIALCRLVQEMPPSDFIWLTDQQRMFTHGLSAKIWAKSGKQDSNYESILGNEMACQAPILPIKP